MSTATDPRSEALSSAGVEQETQGVAEQVRDKAAHMLEGAKESAADMLHSVKEKAGEKVEQLREGAEHLYAQGREKAVELSHQVEGYVRREPMKALAAAAGAGFVLGFLLLPRR